MTDNVNQAESRLKQYTPTDVEDKTCEILRSLLDFAPTQTGRENIARHIATCEDLRELSQDFFLNLLMPSKSLTVTSRTSIHSCLIRVQ
jgi:hypothetical protein